MDNKKVKFIKSFRSCKSAYNPHTCSSENLSDSDYIEYAPDESPKKNVETKSSTAPTVYECPVCKGLFTIGELNTHEYNDKDISENSKDNEAVKEDFFTYEERNTDILNMPVYYKIAHCLPCDGSLGGDTAKRIAHAFGLEDVYQWADFEIGTVDLVHNVFTLYAVEEKYQKTKDFNLKMCVENLARYMVSENITYLAMPRIGCGHGGLDWRDVKPMIISVFNEIFETEGSHYCPHIVFCYQN